MKRKAVPESVKAEGAQKPRLSDSANEAKQSDVAVADVKRYVAQCCASAGVTSVVPPQIRLTLPVQAGGGRR